MKDLDENSKSFFLKSVRNLYKNNPDLAVGFIYYGGLKEMGKELMELVNSREGTSKIIPLLAIREFGLKEYFDDIKNMYENPNLNNLKGNIVLTLYALDR